MQHSAPEQLYLMWTRRAGQTSQPAPVPHLDGPVIWLHADTQHAVGQLDALSGAMMLQQAQQGKHVSVLLSHAAGLHPPPKYQAAPHCP